MVSESTGLVIHFKKHFLLLFNLMEEIISWENGSTDLFLFGGGEQERRSPLIAACSRNTPARHSHQLGLLGSVGDCITLSFLQTQEGGGKGLSGCRWVALISAAGLHNGRKAAFCAQVPQVSLRGVCV